MDPFFAMGGYAAFIWPAYGATAAILIGLLIASVRNLRARGGAETGRSRK